MVCYPDGCGEALSFAVRVTPNNPSWVVQDFNPVSVAMSKMDLTLRPPGALAGELRIRQDAADSVPYAAEFTVQALGRSSVIPALAFEQPAMQTIKQGSSFSLAVSAGIWNIAVTATDQAVPPVSAERTVGSEMTIDPGLVLAGGSLLQIGGWVVKQKGVVWPEAAIPIFSFQLIDIASGMPLSQRRSFAATEQFQVTALNPSGAALLRVMPDPRQNLVVPSKDFRRDLSGSFVDFDQGDFLLGYDDPVEVSGTVLGCSSSACRAEVATPVADIEIRISGRVRGGGSFATTTRSDSAGRFSVELLPTEKADGAIAATEYTFTAEPPLGSAYARASISAEVDGPAELTVPILCPPKALLSGTVSRSVDLEGSRTEPVGDVPIFVEGNPDAAETGRSVVSSLTDASGRFSVLIEPGAYRVYAKPPAVLPWGSRNVSVSSSGEVSIVLSYPREVSGTLVSKDSSGAAVPMAGAKITVYRLPLSSGTTSVLKIYDALTDARGGFKVVVPKASEPDD
jgi:hypothetical protein